MTLEQQDVHKQSLTFECSLTSICRFDYVKGFSGRHVADYVAATNPCFVVGEFWDSLAYDGSVPKRNQDAHRQRTVNWLNSAQGGATAFDVTTKGILHAVFEVQALH